MLSIERVLEIVGDESMSATEAEELRDACRAMAEIIYQKWDAERKAKVSISPTPNSHDENK